MSEPRVNEWVDYVSPFRTGTYDAIVRGVNPDGTVRLEVFLPGAAVSKYKPMEPAITLRSVTYGPEGRARPR